MKLSYRPEVDGFRALAVTLVVLFHAKIPGFSNGYLGVDIFFVISGFLITGIIVRERDGAGFSYGSFIARRVRRILPMLVVVMLVCIPLGWWLMLPDPLENFGQSLVATVFSANNILLWLTSGYWDLASEYKPLLHTWSLGVEEQFYLLYPFALILALRLPLRACLTFLTVLAALSFILMVRAFDDDPAGAFYLLHHRAWQLLVGGIAGILFVRCGWGEKPWLATLGVAMIGVALTLTDLPIWATLSLATFGAAFYLLWATENGPATRVFVYRPIVFIGLISYSFYLWHQPVFAFLRVGFLEMPGYPMFCFGILVSFALAILSWRYVEQPFRRPEIVRARGLSVFVGSGFIVILGAGLGLHQTAGAPSRMQYPNNVGASGATISYNERIRSQLPQDIPADVDRPVVLVVGNSFARDFSNVLLESTLADDITLLYRDTFSLCPNEWSPQQRDLVEKTDILIFASGSYNSCATDIHRHLACQQAVFFVGPKHFGNNINPLVRYTAQHRADTRLTIPADTRDQNNRQSALLGTDYINLIDVLSEDGTTIRVADDDGVLLTTDRIHLSQAGAVYLANLLPVFASGLYDAVALSNRE